MNVRESLRRFHWIAIHDPVCQFFAGTAFREKEPQLPAERIKHVDRFEVPCTPADRDHDRYACHIAGNDGGVSEVANVSRVCRYWLVFRPDAHGIGTWHGT